jgi:DNA-binding transcriptional MerR regulator
MTALGSRKVRPTKEFGHHPQFTEHAESELITINELAAQVGLTTRTIRSYHARGLLPPPTRRGRTPYYDPTHVARMRSILRWQNSGLPLEAIRVLLDPDRVIGELSNIDNLIAGALRAYPDLAHPLIHAGVLRRLPDGTLRVIGARAVLAAFMVGRSGLGVVSALRIIADSVPEVLPYTQATWLRIQQIKHGHLTYDVDEESMVGLSIEVLRLCLTRLAREG